MRSLKLKLISLKNETLKKEMYLFRLYAYVSKQFSILNDGCC